MGLLIRIGDGRTPSGKILDPNTHWFAFEEKEDAIKDAIETGKRIYVSRNKGAYRQITIGQLMDLH